MAAVENLKLLSIIANHLAITFDDLMEKLGPDGNDTMKKDIRNKLDELEQKGLIRHRDSVGTAIFFMTEDGVKKVEASKTVPNALQALREALTTTKH